MSRTCYVIAAYLGARRNHNPRQVADRWYLLRRHFEQLRQLRHTLDSIIVVLSSDQYVQEESDLRRFCQEHGYAVDILARPNSGYSYGAWSDAYLRYRAAFDYYILIEDDYLPVVDDFDQKLRAIIEADPACGYLCGLVQDYSIVGDDGHRYAVPHASLSNGIVRAAAMAAVVKEFGCLPHVPTTDYPSGCRSQVQFSNAFPLVGWGLRDWRKHYSAPYWHGGRLAMLRGGALPPLIVPVEYVEHGAYTAGELAAVSDLGEQAIWPARGDR